MRRPAGRTPLPIWTGHKILSAAQPKWTELDRFGHQNGSTRWRFPYSTRYHLALGQAALYRALIHVRSSPGTFASVGRQTVGRQRKARRQVEEASSSGQWQAVSQCVSFRRDFALRLDQLPACRPVLEHLQPLKAPRPKSGAI
jgi:hypothetical protein